nr:MAG TPA: hypothetical protein [Caudoviricetes sp.]
MNPPNQSYKEVYPCDRLLYIYIVFHARRLTIITV